MAMALAGVWDGLTERRAPRVLPSTTGAALVVQGRRLDPGSRLDQVLPVRLVEGDSEAERAKTLAAIKRERRKAGDRARQARYRAKPEVKARAAAREKSGRYRATRQAYDARNSDRLRELNRERQRRYRADPAKAAVLNERARVRARARRALPVSPQELAARRERDRAYRAANREAINARQRAWKARKRAEALAGLKGGV
jgi:hypothetical protein